MFYNNRGCLKKVVKVVLFKLVSVYVYFVKPLKKIIRDECHTVLTFQRDTRVRKKKPGIKFLIFSIASSIYFISEKFALREPTFISRDSDINGISILPTHKYVLFNCVNNHSAFFFRKKASELKVLVNGKIVMSEEDQAGRAEKRHVSEIVSHPDYNNNLLYNDVALLILKKNFKLKEGLHPINTLCLPPATVNLEGGRCFVAGWGDDKSGKRKNHQSIILLLPL